MMKAAAIALVFSTVLAGTGPEYASARANVPTASDNLVWPGIGLTVKPSPSSAKSAPPIVSLQVAQLAGMNGQTNAPEPTYSWTVTRKSANGPKQTFAATDLYAVDDPDDMTAPYRWASTLFLMCIDSDHLEYVALPGTKQLTFGPNSQTPKPITVAVRTDGPRGRISAADSIAISRFLMQALEHAAGWNANGEADYVEVLVDGNRAYLNLKNFAAVRQEMLSTCLHPQPQKQQSILTANLDQFCSYLDQSNRRTCSCQRDVIMRNAKAEEDVVGAIALIKNRPDLADQLSRELGGGIMAQSGRTLFWKQIALAASGCGH